MSLVVPAVLPSSKKELEEKLELLSQIPSVSRIQIDVVDGTFASPASWPYTASGELADMKNQSAMLPSLDRFTYEIDLMCVDPEQAVADWSTIGATHFIFHAESVSDVPLLLASVKKRFGAGGGFASSLLSFGIAINLGSDLALVEQNLAEVDYVQLMGIGRIGRQGQPLDERVFEKARNFHHRHPDVPLQVDGGVTLENAHQLLAAGVTNLVVGSAILHAADPTAAFAAFEELESSFGV